MTAEERELLQEVDEIRNIAARALANFDLLIPYRCPLHHPLDRATGFADRKRSPYCWGCVVEDRAEAHLDSAAGQLRGILALSGRVSL